MELVDKFTTIEPVHCFNVSVDRYHNPTVSNEFKGYYLAEVEIFREGSEVRYRKTIIDCPEYQKVLEGCKGKKSGAFPKDLGVCIDGGLFDLERKNKEGIKKWSKELGYFPTAFPIFLSKQNGLLQANDKDVLVLGSGKGSFISDLKMDYFDDLQVQPRVTAIDLNENYIEQSREKHPDIKHDVADMVSLPYENSSSDIVIAGLVYNYVMWPRSAVEESARVLRPGGFVAAAECYIEKGSMQRFLEESGLEIVINEQNERPYHGMPLYYFIAKKKEK